MTKVPYTVGCTVWVEVHPTLFGFLMIGTQSKIGLGRREKKGRREALRAREYFSRRRHDAKARGGWHAEVKERTQRSAAR